MREEDTLRRNISQKGRGSSAYYILIELNYVGGSLSVQALCPSHSLADSDRTSREGGESITILSLLAIMRDSKYY